MMLYIKAVLLCAFLSCFTNSEGLIRLAINDSYQYHSGLQVLLKLHREPADWQIARMKCHEEGATLAAPWNDQFWSFLLKHVSVPDNLTIYAGVQEDFPEGVYNKNNSGKPILSLKLQDTINLARCVVYHPSGTKELVDCKLPFAYVCQAPAVETLGCGGLDNVDIDFQLDSRTGSCYKFYDTCKTWYDAYKTCQAEGAYLAIINSETEFDLLKKMTEQHPWEKLKNIDIWMKYKAIAVGFYYWKEADTYMTIHGESIEQAGYAKWYNNQAPKRNLSGGIMYLNGSLGEIDKVRRVPFICEKTPVLRKTKYPLWFF